MDVDPSTPLLYVLRNDLDLHGPRFGCGLGQCSVCTVIMDGTRRALLHHARGSSSAARSRRSKGSRRTASCIRLQEAWIEEQAAQCGYCQNGQIMTAKALLDRNPQPERRGNPRSDGRRAVPVHDLLPGAGRNQTGASRADKETSAAGEGK